MSTTAARKFSVMDELFADEDEEGGVDAKYKSAAAEQYLNVGARTVNAAAPQVAYARADLAPSATDRDAEYFKNGEHLEPSEEKMEKITFQLNTKFRAANLKNNADVVRLTVGNKGLKVISHTNQEDSAPENKELSKYGVIQKIFQYDANHDLPDAECAVFFPTVPATKREKFDYQDLYKDASKAPYGVVSAKLSSRPQEVLSRDHTKGKEIYLKSGAAHVAKGFDQMYYAHPQDPTSVYVQVAPVPAPFLSKYNEHEDVVSGKLPAVIEDHQLPNFSDPSKVVVTSEHEGGFKYLKGAFEAIKWAANVTQQMNDEHIAFANVTNLDEFAIDLRPEVTGEYNADGEDSHENKLVSFAALPYAEHKGIMELAANPNLDSKKKETAKGLQQRILNRLNTVGSKFDVYYKNYPPTMVPKNAE